jgi:catechol 2,3-dioxygenase-like lactoylglutathione lyase family enzyme
MFEIHDINHVNIVVRDLEKAIWFYCDVLGMENSTRNPAFASRGAWLRKNNAEIHLIHIDSATHVPGDLSFAVAATTDVEISNSRHFSLVIDNTESLVVQLQNHNIPIVYGPVERPGGLVQTYCYDPDGHLIEFSHFSSSNFR